MGSHSLKKNKELIKYYFKRIPQNLIYWGKYSIWRLMSVSGLLDFCRSFVSQHNVYDFTGKIL